MAKAGLLEAQFPVVKVRTRRNDAWNRCRVMPRHEPWDGATSVARSAAQWGRSRRWVGGLRRARHVWRRRTAGSPTGRES